jgi:hypothetical protein
MRLGVGTFGPRVPYVTTRDGVEQGPAGSLVQARERARALRRVNRPTAGRDWRLWVGGALGAGRLAHRPVRRRAGQLERARPAGGHRDAPRSGRRHGRDLAGAAGRRPGPARRAARPGDAGGHQRGSGAAQRRRPGGPGGARRARPGPRLRAGRRPQRAAARGRARDAADQRPPRAAAPGPGAFRTSTSGRSPTSGTSP